MELDPTDRKLISLLRENSRLPVSSLAMHLNVSRATVQNRIARLTDRGVIQGFSVRLKTDVETSRIRAITLIQSRAKQTNEVLKSLSGLPEISALHTTNGRWDIVAELNTENLEEFDTALSYIREIEGVANTETSLLLTSHKM
jgi:DNA-binding Lrp family transcriptional regulator